MSKFERILADILKFLHQNPAKARFLVWFWKEALCELTYNKLHLVKKESFATSRKGFSNLSEQGEYVISLASFID